MKKLMAVLTVLVLCTNAFGEILVYRVSGHTSGFTVGPSLQPNTGMNFKGGFRGYMAVNVNTSTLNSVASDVNNRPEFLVLGRKSFVNLSPTVPNVTSASFDLTVANDQYSQKFAILTKSGKVTRKAIVLPQFTFRYFTSSPKLDVQFSNGLLDGLLNSVDIGNPANVILPRSIKGEAFYFITTNVGGAQESAGRVSLRLDSSLTKQANTRAIPLTVAQTISQIEQKLTSRGYKEMTPEQFFGQ